MDKHVGIVTQVIGPVIDIEFNEEHLPKLLNAIEINHDG
ncbi:MAG: hypothetical protein GX323_04110, partial [Clostridiales bacterium]|nr:hypothetical protein [Clostridiales bacterium]